jgi:transposase
LSWKRSAAHHWGRGWRDGSVRLPARYGAPERNKTDADAAALIEASRADDLAPVRVKSIEQQALQALHRSRSAWMATRTARINTLRGFCREFGIAISQGSRIGLEQIGRQIADPASGLPALLRPTMRLLLEEIRLLEMRISQLEVELARLARQSAACTTLLTVPGVGLLTATAMVAATSGEVTHFKDARHFASLFGLTPKESSSGMTRRWAHLHAAPLLRMLLTRRTRVLRPPRWRIDRAAQWMSCRWALAVQSRTHHNRATCALANKMARICYAVLRDHADYGGVRIERKMRQTYALPS